MAITKEYQRRAFTAGQMGKVQSLTNASTAVRVTNYGVTSISSTAGGTAAVHAYQMDAPTKGLRKTLVVNAGSTRTVSVDNASTAVTFFGSTEDGISFSTGAGKYRSIELVGLSATQWAVVAQTTGVTLA
jgi:hypothetical protein